MEQYIVSARKYRPATFESVVGQQSLTATLKNAIATGRLAHAYLFCGSRGVGKTSCARIFAKTINCTSRTPSGEACNECDSCRQFNENRSLNIIELDAASNNGVDDIKGLMEQVLVPPTHGRYRVFIIDEVHMLSTAAFNAFLKTLEEPPAHAIFILATTEKHKILPTILSRCQIYDFNRITINDMVAHMQKVAAMEGYNAEPEALSVIAKKADGAMRDALSIFDQVAASTRGNITYEATIANLNVLDHAYYSRLLDAFVSGDVASALLVYKEVRERGFDSQFFINGLGQYLRDLAVASNPATLQLVEATDAVRAEMVEKASKLHPTFLYKGMDLCNQADFNFRQASNKQFLIELTLIKLCQLLSPSPDEGGDDGGRLKPLESGRVAASAPTQATVTPQAAPPRQSAKPAAPKPAVRPYTTSAPQPARAAEATATFSPGSLSLGSLRNMSHKATDAEAPVEAKAKQQRREAYSDADIASAWPRAVAATNPGPMLSSLLGNAIPERGSGDSFTLRVSSDMEAEIMSKALGDVQRNVRDILRNDFITFAPLVSATELPKHLWTDDKVLEDIISAHPGVKHLIDKYQLRRN